MNFSENEIFGAALIGFDMIDGPFLKWKKDYEKNSNIVNLDDFAMNFYLAFRGGNEGKKPRAILYDDFYIVAFPKELELCCLFMKPKGVDNNIKQLNKIAYRLITEMEVEEKEEQTGNLNSEDTEEDLFEETKRLIPNLLSGTEMSTPALRKYFKLNNSQIWKIMSELESEQKIMRTEKKGRSVYWTAK